MSEIDGRDTYLLIALQERGAVPGGMVAVSFDPAQNPRLARLVQAGLIVQCGRPPSGILCWQLTGNGLAFLAGVAMSMGAMVERVDNG